MSSGRLGVLLAVAVCLFAMSIRAIGLTGADTASVAGSREVAAAGASPARAPTPPARVVVWGDSLVKESAGPFELAVRLSGSEVESYSFGGSAPCDWNGTIAQRLGGPEIDIALLEFSGNALTPCVQDENGKPLTGSALLDKYTADVEHLALRLRDHGATVYLVGPPVLSPRIDETRVPGLLGRYRELADRHEGVHFVDAGQAVLEKGSYVEWLPCQPSEDATRGCLDGKIRVRSTDGVHFCPIRRVGDECPTYSSGAFRFGMAMAAAVTNGAPTDHR